jgi:uncharacterized protein YecE (DUF72 family)
VGRARIFIGTAGWTIPRAVASHFADDGTHLERYARILAGAEINSSFHRPHAVATYAKWAGATPASFRFAVKLPRIITHDQRLRRARQPLVQFLQESAGLGRRRGPLLVQLPPSLSFEPRVASRFFSLLRDSHDGAVVCEPRHPEWFSAAADALLVRFQVARVAADPPPVPGAERGGGWKGLTYFRLHGSPRKYWSTYTAEQIAALTPQILDGARTGDVWCIFDNTASGAALANALDLHSQLQR